MRCLFLSVVDTICVLEINHLWLIGLAQKEHKFSVFVLFFVYSRGTQIVFKM